MEEINLFRKELQQHLQWNAARLAFVSIFLTHLTQIENPEI
jgi:hypothetical protein